MINFGIIKPGSVLEVIFDSFAGSTGASITLTGLAVTDIEIYKDGSVTQRASDSGYALLDTDGIDIDGITGIHGFTIDLADNATAGFYAAGSRYFVIVSAVTVDGQTVNFVAAVFRIGLPNVVLNTTIATLSSQTSFTLTAGPAEDDALNGCVVYIHDVASAVQAGFAIILDYTGATKTVTLAAGTTFTAATTDNISVFHPDRLPAGAIPYAVAGAAGGLPVVGTGTNNFKSDASANVTFANTVIATVTTLTNLPAITANWITAAGITDGAFTAAKFASGAFDAVWTVTTRALSAGAAALEASLQTLITTVGAAGAGLTAAASAAIQAIRDRISPIVTKTGAIVSDGGNSATTFVTDLTESTNDYWKDSFLRLTSGAMVDQVKKISAYNGTTKAVTVIGGFTSTPAAGVTFEIVND